MTTDSPSTDLVFAQASLKDRLDWARAISGAGALVPSGFRDGNNPNPAKILLAVEYGAMLGLHPMAALSGLHIIDGKPTLSAALMSAQVHKTGHKLRISSRGSVHADGRELGGDFEVTATLIRKDDQQHPFVVTWTIDRAKRAGLWGQGNWRKYPENQMTWRAVSEVTKAGAPEVLLGVWYTPDELGATVNEDGEVIEDAVIVEDEPRVSTPKPTPTPEPETFEPAPWEDRLAYAGTSNELHKLWLDAGRAGVLDEALSDGQPFRDAILGKKARLEQDMDTAPVPAPKQDPTGYDYPPTDDQELPF